MNTELHSSQSKIKEHHVGLETIELSDMITSIDILPDTVAINKYKIIHIGKTHYTRPP